MFKIIFSDFDGTLTYKESLNPIFFEIQEFLQNKKIPLVIVTGRSLSWGHFLLTHFPFLTDVIVEGGGAILSRTGKIITEECLVTESEILRLQNFCTKFKLKFPDAPLSVDSFGRKTDRAIELHDLKDEILFQYIEDFFRQEKITFSRSSVHLNFWCGEISKYRAVQHFLEGKKLDADHGIFFGDSLNDQSMFKSFKNSVGVSNLESVLHLLEFKPKTILQGKENIGPWGVLNYLKAHLA